MTRCRYCGREIQFIPELGIWLLNYGAWVEAVSLSDMDTLYFCSPAGRHEPPDREAIVNDLARIALS